MLIHSISRRASLVACTLVLMPALTLAQSNQEVPRTSTVIVSATRTAQTVDETLAPVSVVTREDIERLQARSVRDVLRGLPGVSIANNGGPGKATSLFLRGSESDHVLVLVDGVKVGSATLGSFGFQDIPIEQVERIELVRGPRASLYGSEALGGVLQIFTRRGEGEVRPFARVTLGSRHTFESSGGVSGSVGRGWFNLSGSAETTRGIDSCRGVLFAGCFTIEPDRDGYRNRSISARGGYSFTDDIELELHSLTTSGYNQFDGGAFTGNEGDVRKQVLGGKFTASPLDTWLITVRGGRSRDETDSFFNGVFVSEFLTRRDTFTVQNDVQVADDHLVTVGGDWQRDAVDGSTAYPVSGRWNKAVFIQYQGSFGAHDLQAAYRHDRNQQFGVANTGSAAWGWNITRGLKVVASYGRAFKAPTFNELYFPFFGDPTLEPERSRTAEISLRGQQGVTRWSVGAFRSEVRNLIGFDPATFTAINVGRANIRGIEATMTTKLIGFDVTGNATLLEPRNDSPGANFDNLLPRRSRHVVRVDVDRRFGDFSVGTTVVVEGERFDDPANTRRLGGYTLVDLRAQYDISKAWTVQARVENLLDKRYETAAFFRQPDRGAFVTLRYQP